MEYRTESEQPFGVLDRALTLLTTGPGQLVLGTAGIDGLDKEELLACEVHDLLRYGPQEVTDGLWHRVLARSRAGEPAWTVIAAGAMLPAMVTASARYSRVPAHHIADVESELLTALLEQMRSIPIGVSAVQHRLWSAVANTANRYCYRLARDSSTCDPTGVPAPGSRGRGPVTVLAEAVSEGALTPPEADLVARTRLEGATLARVAQDLGLSYITARRWRKAAEERLASLLVTKEFSAPMSDIGT